MTVCHQDDSEAKIHDEMMLSKEKKDNATCIPCEFSPKQTRQVLWTLPSCSYCFGNLEGRIWKWKSRVKGPVSIRSILWSWMGSNLINLCTIVFAGPLCFHRALTSTTTQQEPFDVPFEAYVRPAYLMLSQPIFSNSNWSKSFLRSEQIPMFSVLDS
jgi:hypothetical protein